MRKITEILSKVQDEVAGGLRKAIEGDDVRCEVECDFGKAVIGVEVTKFGVIDVWVCHEDARKRSPLIEELAMKVVPSWDDVEYEVERERELCPGQDDFEVFGLYD